MDENISRPDVGVAHMDSDDDEISLLDLAIILAKRKKLLIILPFSAAIISIVASLLLPNIYTATTKILPPIQSQSTASAVLAQLGGAASTLGVGAGMKNPNDVYIGMLKSRTVGDSLVERFDLARYYKTELKSKAREALESTTKITSGKDGLITIEVDGIDPKFATELANAYVDEVKKLMRVLAVTEASQRRLFFENQLLQARENLLRAEITAKQAMENGGLTNVETQGRTLLETTARLRGQIAAKEVQIGAMRAFAGERNQELLKTQQELAAMRNELAKAEGSAGGSDGLIGKGRGFENLKLLRDIKYFETINELLAKQFELAKIDEAKDMAIIQVMDMAVVPDRKSKPKRSLIVLVSTLAAFFVAVIWAFIAEALEKSRANPETAMRMQTFRRYLAWRT